MNGKATLTQRARLAALGVDPQRFVITDRRGAVSRPVARAGAAGTRAGSPADGGTPVLIGSDLPVPANSDELAEMIGDDKRFAVIAKSRETLTTFIDTYAKSQQAEGTRLHATVAEEAQRAAMEWLKEHGTINDSVKRLNLDPQARSSAADKWRAGYNRRAPGAVLDDKFEDAADFFKAAWHLNQDPQNVDRMRNAYSSVTPADGGFLVPEAFRSEMLRIALEQSIVRSRARVIPMEAARVSFPTVDSTTNVGSIHGGIIAYWTEESAALVESQAKFGKVTLDANKLTAYAVVPNELLRDSMLSFAAFVDQTYPEALAWFEDLAFIRGSGVGEPLGFLGANNTAGVEVAKETGQAAATVLWTNIIKMYARMLPSSLNRAVWLVSPDVFPELATMALSVGTGGSAVWLTNGATGAPMTILGRPVIMTEKMNALGTRGDIAFVDLGYYLVGDRQAMEAASSTHARFGYDQTVYRFIERVDGRPWLTSAITPANGGAALSPFVELATRA